MFLMGLTREERNYLRWDWSFWARPEQLQPDGDWTTWIVNAGRGFGKTRLGAEWVRNMVCGRTPLAGTQYGRIALVGETAADVRDVMVQGPSGILATSPPDFRPKYTKMERKLEWPNGAIALCFSAMDPEQLRGPEHGLAWCDELAKWRYSDEVFDMLQFGLRLANPRQLITTTPKPIPLMRRLLQQAKKEQMELGSQRASVIVTSGSTYDNAANLASKFLQQMRERYEGTRLGRQELRAELLDDVMGALWTRRMFDVRSPQAPLAAVLPSSVKPPRMLRVVVAVDPSGTSGDEDEDGGGDAVGIVAAGLGIDGNYYILADDTCNLPPSGWSQAVVNCYRHWGADRIVAERNYGGAMVEFTIRTADRYVAYSDVTATRGKTVRAEPIAALYERGKVLHVGSFPDLENELCAFTKTGYVGGNSPNRADALVWALTELIGEGEEDEYDPEIYRRLGQR